MCRTALYSFKEYGFLPYRFNMFMFSVSSDSTNLMVICSSYCLGYQLNTALVVRGTIFLIRIASVSVFSIRYSSNIMSLISCTGRQWRQFECYWCPASIVIFYFILISWLLPVFYAFSLFKNQRPLLAIVRCSFSFGVLVKPQSHMTLSVQNVFINHKWKFRNVN